MPTSIRHTRTGAGTFTDTAIDLHITTITLVLRITDTTHNGHETALRALGLCLTRVDEYRTTIACEPLADSEVDVSAVARVRITRLDRHVT